MIVALGIRTEGASSWELAPDRFSKSRVALVFLVASVLAGALPRSAAARHVSATVKCRNHIGSSVEALVRSGFHMLDACSVRTDGATKCAHLDGRAGMSRAVERADGIVKYWCSKESAILQNYSTPDSTPTSVMRAVAPFVQTILEDSTANILPGAATDTDRRARRRCIRAIAGGRSSVASAVLAGAVGCQRAIDRQASGFAELAPSCLRDASPAAARAATKIARACRDVRPQDVGSCDPLPECVIASARTAGNDLAKAAYGAKAVCGNSKIEPGEGCDDGAANSATGTCTDTCQMATCGDGKVEAGVEDCDNGKKNGRSVNTCSCTATCRVTQSQCGDGRRQGCEQCDDGNTTAGDGCSPTCTFEPIACPSAGTVDLTVTLVPNQDTFSSPVASIKVDVSYSATESLPGSGLLDVGDPNDPSTLVALLGQCLGGDRNGQVCAAGADCLNSACSNTSTEPNVIHLYDGIQSVFDADATAPDTRNCSRSDSGGGGPVCTLLTLNPTANVMFHSSEAVPFERIRFGCSPGSPVSEADFPCVVTSLTNAIAGPVSSDQFPECQVVLPRGGA